LVTGCDIIEYAIAQLRQHSEFECRGFGELAHTRFVGGGLGYDPGDVTFSNRAAYVRLMPGSDTTLATAVPEDFNVYVNPLFFDISLGNQMAVLAHEEVHHLGYTHVDGYADHIFDICR
jgi:hypothetical protein